MSLSPSPQEDNDHPPILGTWNRLYGFLLLSQAVLVLLFYWFTRAFS